MRWHHPDFHEIVRERIRKANEEGIAGPMIESKYFKLDGTVMDLEVQGKPIIYNGSPSILATFNDVTDRKKAEQKLRTAEENYRVLLNGSSNGILAIDIETHQFLFSNPTICKLFGYTDIEFQRLSIENLVPKESLGIVMSEFASHIREEKPTSFSIPCQRKDGTIFYSDIASAPVTLGGRKCSVGFFIDVTERVQAENKLRESEKRFSQVVEQSQEVVWEVDSNGLYTYVSPMAQAIYGYLPEQMINKIYFYDLHPEAAREKFKKNIFNMFRRKMSFYKLVNSIVKPDGTTHILNTTGIPVLDEKGNLAGYRGVDNDITEHKQMEKDLQDSEKRFRMLAENSTDMISCHTLDGAYTYASPACKSLLGYGPEELIGHSCYEFINVETLPEVKGDENLIRQVWTNLISNAIKHTMKKQEAIIEIGSFSTDDELTFFIKDNGAGFNMKYAEKLFKVFQRLHKSRDFEGVGIGLANVNRIVARHGGHCRAEGEVDKGATFYFSLPVTGF